MTAFSIRFATIDDAPAIAALHCASWRSAYAGILDAAFLDGPIEQDRLLLWAARLSEPSPAQIVLLACAPDGEVVGFVCAYLNHDERWGSLIDNIHVSPTRRGQHCGEQMMRAVAAELAARGSRGGMYLWVFDANEGGRRFYARLGGVPGDREVSPLPATNGATVTRIAWSDSRLLADSTATPAIAP